MTRNHEIIVIEDDGDLGLLFTETMKMSGVSVLAIGSNGQDAIELFKKHKPQVVVLDLMMPEFDGFYAIDGIQKIDPNAKILVLTADLTEKTRTNLAQLKTIHTIFKPYEINDVVNEIKKLIDSEPVLIDNN
jgi:DNA-binding response OmpR family regulator